MFAEKFDVEKLFASFPVNINFGVLSRKPYNNLFAERTRVMNRSVTTVLCVGIVWTTGLSDTTEAGLQPQEGRKTKISSVIMPEISEIVGDYVLIYKPQPDIYTGKDTKHYKAGETYTNWQPNDHTFIKGPDNRWHCFGITRPNDVKDDGIHEGEGLCFHAVAPLGELQQALRPKSWMDWPKLSISGCGWAPYAIKIGSAYSVISSNKGHAESTDLYTWKDKGKLSIKGGDRDPDIMYWNGTYYLVRCNNRSVTLVTSRDFVNWSEPVDIFTAPEASWNCESPTLMRHNDTFYLFWCLWDSAGSGAELPALYDGHDPSTYDYRTYVYASDTPTNFHNRSPVTELKAHAPEIVQDEKGDYFISSADYPQRGINLARLVWKSSNKENSEQESRTQDETTNE